MSNTPLNNKLISERSRIIKLKEKVNAMASYSLSHYDQFSQLYNILMRCRIKRRLKKKEKKKPSFFSISYRAVHEIINPLILNVDSMFKTKKKTKTMRAALIPNTKCNGCDIYIFFKRQKKTTLI